MNDDGKRRGRCARAGHSERVGRFWRGALIAGATAALTVGVAAQPSLEGKIDEVYDEDAKRTGMVNFLAGVMLGDVPDKISFSSLYGWVPKGMAGTRLCFLATTIDGVYRASGALQVPANAEGLLKIKPTPPLMAYARKLESYRPGHFAARLVASKDCNATDEGLSLPVAFVPDPKPVLRIAVLGEAIGAEFVLPRGATLSRGECKGAGERGQRKSFDHECRFDRKALPEGPADVHFEVEKSGKKSEWIARRIQAHPNP